MVASTPMPTCRVPDEWLLGGRHAILLGREVLRGLLADLNSRGTTVLTQQKLQSSGRQRKCVRLRHPQTVRFPEGDYLKGLGILKH